MEKMEEAEQKEPSKEPQSNGADVAGPRPEDSFPEPPPLNVVASLGHEVAALIQANGALREAHAAMSRAHTIASARAAIVLERLEQK